MEFGISLRWKRSSKFIKQSRNCHLTNSALFHMNKRQQFIRIRKKEYCSESRRAKNTQKLTS